MKQHYRRPSLVMVCILGVALAGAALADDDMHKKDAMPGAMGQQPASTPAAPHAPAAHPTDPKSPASQNAPATPDAMATHREEMAAMMQRGAQGVKTLSEADTGENNALGALLGGIGGGGGQ